MPNVGGFLLKIGSFSHVRSCDGGWSPCLRHTRATIRWLDVPMCLRFLRCSSGCFTASAHGVRLQNRASQFPA